MSGGEEIKFTGTGFSEDEITTVLIDGIECVVDEEEQTETKIYCTTGEKKYSDEAPSLSIHIDGFGYVETT